MQIAHFNPVQLMARPRVAASVPEDVYEFLAEWAEREQRPLSNLVAYVLTTAVRQMMQQSEQQDESKTLTTKQKIPRQ
jgi:hypothetical protein